MNKLNKQKTKKLLDQDKQVKHERHQNKQEQKVIPCSLNNIEFVLILVVLSGALMIFSTLLAYNIYGNLQRTNEKLQKMQQKFDKFLIYINYIYTSHRNREQQSEKVAQKQQSIITTIINKINANTQSIQKKQQSATNTSLESQEDNKLQSKKQLQDNSNPDGQKVTKNKIEKEKSFQENVSLLSNQQIMDIALKIIQVQHKQQKARIQQNKKNQIQNAQINQQQQPFVVTKQNEIVRQVSKVKSFICQIDRNNRFNRNFEYLSDSLTLKKTIYTYNFQSMFCQQPIPKQGVWQMSIKIVQTLKGWIYIGVAGGQTNSIYNLTSLHQNQNFYGYSGYSGRVLEGKSRTKAFLIIKNKDVFKYRIDMNSKRINYFVNDQLIAQSNLANLCQQECRFVIQMYNQGDQIQFLKPFIPNTLDTIQAQIF